jgi:iron-sulfur cluster repair protein YtfE (RIC family)
MAKTLIAKDMTMNEVTRRHPATLRIFHEFGVDSCCGGAQPIGVAAGQEGLDLSAIPQALNAVLKA